MSESEEMRFDVIIVGGGPSGLACAIHLKQLKPDLAVCVLEKGGEIGAHILSGAVIETRALDELLPDWASMGAPIHTKVTSDSFMFLSKKRAFRLPTPPAMHNTGNYIVSLGLVTRWLGEEAQKLGVEIYPGFPAKELLFDADQAVKGVLTGEMGRDKQGAPGPNFQPGMALLAPITVFAEGCRGSLGRELMTRYRLRANCDPQSYAIGLKELWEVPETDPGKVMHTIGWPLSRDCYGGSFLYHLDKTKIAVGFVIGLDYRNPHLSPYHEFQRFKHHPRIAQQLRDGKRIAYGARALNEGGLQSIPKLSFPGGLLVGCEAGFMNVPKIKGSHGAIKSGQLAAASIAAHFDAAGSNPSGGAVLESYDKAFRESWLYQELALSRNIRPSFRYGLFAGLAYSALDTYLFRGRAPWTFRNIPDHTHLLPKDRARRPDYPAPDQKLSFDKLTNLTFSNVYHEENQPTHLVLTKADLAVDCNWNRYGGPEQNFCPAGVYEFVKTDKADEVRLQINAQNCVHCKTCDIKDLNQNIVWKPPEGGGGPNYEMM